MKHVEKIQVDNWVKKYKEKLGKVDIREINFLRRRAEDFLRKLREKGYILD